MSVQVLPLDNVFPFESIPFEFLAILESLNECVALADDFGSIRYVNNRFLDLTGYEKSEVIGKRIFEVYFPERGLERKTEIDLMKGRWQDRRKGLSSVYETHIYRKDGTRRWIETRAAPLYAADGEIVGSIGAISDITSRKNLEDELRWSQKMEVVGRLAGGVAHDFNNLLAVIMGYVELLKTEVPESDSTHRKLNVIYDASKSAASLTQQLLSLSKKDILKVENINLNDLIYSSSKLIEGAIGERISLKLDMTSLPTTILGDANLIQRVLLNLVVNARDAMLDGGVLTIKTLLVDIHGFQIIPNSNSLEKKFVELLVIDNGVGMSEEVLSRIFEPMFTTKSSQKGSGIGLTVTFNIVKQHDGRISVKSKLGQGTTFSVQIPFEESNVSIPESSHDAMPMSIRGSEKLLVVEDNRSVRNLLCDTLKYYGYDVILAQDALEAISILNNRSDEISLVITDLVMPGLSGLELMELMKTEHPQVKFLIMSGCPGELDEKEKIEQINIEYLPKPFNQEQMLTMIRKIIDSKK